MKNVLIDCDPGIDDAVAIMFALGCGALDVRAITTVSGNLTADRCAANARKILDLIQAPAIPVTQGMATPLVRPFPRDPFFHGDDGLGELGIGPSGRLVDPRFAPDVIVETVDAHRGDIDLIALGPLTNIALAVMRDPQLPKKVRSLIIIGGAFGFHSAGATRATGDNPVSEWNIYVDPEAADLVFKAGFHLTAVGLDVATRPDVELTGMHRERLRHADTPAGRFLLGVVDFVERRSFASYCGLIDSIAVAAAIDATLLRTEPVSVAVETASSLSRGQTIVDRREHFRWTHLPTIHAAADLDVPRFLDGLVAALC